MRRAQAHWEDVRLGQLQRIGSFGDVAAEQDSAMLSYFLKTEAVDKIESGGRLMVLGRKGSGKTALTRYFQTSRASYLSEALSLRDYPWGLHQKRANLGASDIESYVSSWRYLIALRANAMLLKHSGVRVIHDTQRAARSFFEENYGGVQPALADTLKPKRLTFAKAALRPMVMGNSLGEINFETVGGGVSPEIDAITDALIENATTMAGQLQITKAFLHFDELDQGLHELDDIRQRMLVGLVLAARSFLSGRSSSALRIVPVVYLRTDLWDEMQFSDKNKISQSLSVILEWNAESLKDLINRRIEAKLGTGKKWDDIDDGKLMRGSQTKWNHVIARTFLRPRDVIQFLNHTLSVSKKSRPDGDQLENSDIISAREPYSRYLKQELDDEIVPHWPNWAESVQALAEIATVTFKRQEFERVWAKKKASSAKSADAALEMMYQFSVIGYRRGIGKGGSGWTFQYADPDAGWDNGATRLRVHQGLKEFAKLREERA